MDTSLPYASVVEEYSGGSATPSARYDYGDDLVRMDRGSGVYYYIYDGLGSTRQLISTTGAVTDSYGFSAFGELASHIGTTANPFLFNAQQFDQASGDYYLRARYYDQSNGRFISQDPFGGNNSDPISLHRYLYASGDPVNRVDPSGAVDFSLTGLGISVGIGATLGAVGGGLSSFALTGHVSWEAVGIGALSGAAFAGVGYAVAVFAPAGVATGLAWFGAGAGFGGAVAVALHVFLDPTAKPSQKLAAIALVIFAATSPAISKAAYTKLSNVFATQSATETLVADPEGVGVGPGNFPETDLALGMHANLRGFAGRAQLGLDFDTQGQSGDFFKDTLAPGIDKAVANGATIRFRLDGIDPNAAVNPATATKTPLGTSAYDSYTSQELRYVLANYPGKVVFYNNGEITLPPKLP